MVLEVSGDRRGAFTPAGSARPVRSAVRKFPARIVKVDIVRELDGDDRQSGNGFRRMVARPVAPLTAFSMGLGDKLFHLLRREAWRFGLDIHGGGHEFGEHIQRRAARRP